MRRWLALVLLLAAAVARAEWLPPRLDRLVNDYSGVLSAEQAAGLERRLVAFADSTSNQVVVVITPTLEGDDEQSAAQRLGERWGVGQSRFDNGLVILIKSKTPDEDWGAVALATGYGVEGALPDVFCKRIIDDRMLPALGEGDYYGAVVAALDVVEPAMRGEYSFGQYRDDERRAALRALLPLIVFFVAVIVALVLYYKKHPDQWNNTGRGGGGGGGIYLGGFPGSFGDGRGSSGGSFGGFGGFGGGSFGGGGASGRF